MCFAPQSTNYIDAPPLGQLASHTKEIENYTLKKSCSFVNSVVIEGMINQWALQDSVVRCYFKQEFGVSVQGLSAFLLPLVFSHV